MNLIGENIWTVDGPNVVFAGASMNTRMTVIRLADNRLWIHSPIALSPVVASFIDDLGGNVVALIAPNKFHYLFLNEWRERFPHAGVFVDSALAAKVPELAGMRILHDIADRLYAEEIDQLVLRGNRMFQEVVFFHRASRSLILTDLMINLKTDDMSLLPKLFLAFEGVTYPNGGVPRLYRWFTRDKDEARRGLAVIRSWDPIRILFCHGEPIPLAARELLDREFSYLN